MQKEFDFDKHIDTVSEYKDKSKYPYKAGHRGHRNSIVSANETNKKLRRLQKQILIELYKNPKGLIGSIHLEGGRIHFDNQYFYFTVN